ncbi:AAA family ATPase [bacterium]|nr:AAA family ATPase [bacterium]
MKLKTVRIKDFMTIHKATVELDNQGIVLLLGENRDDKFATSNLSGKSTIFEAICWGLYGKTYRGIKGKEVIRDGCSGCKVEVELEDSTFINRERTENKEYLSTMYPIEFGSVPNDTALTQESLNEKLGMDFNTFTSFVYFGDDTANKNITLFGEATNSEKFKTLKAFLNFDLWDTGYANAKSELDKLENSIRKIATEKIELNNKNKVIEAKMESLSEHLKSLWESLHSLSNPENQDDLNLEMGMKDLSDKELDLLAKKKALIESKVNIANQRSSLMLKKSKVEAENGSINANILRISDKIRDLESAQSTKICPFCKQEIKEDTEWTNCYTKIEELEKEIQYLSANMLANKDAIEALKIEVAQLGDKESEVWRLICEVDDEMKEISSKMGMIKQKEKSKAERETSIKRYGNEIGKTEESLENMEKAIKSNSEMIKLLDESVIEIEHKCRILRFWVKQGFKEGGAKNVELRRIIPFINNHIKSYVSSILSSDYPITLSPCRELKSGNIKNEISVEMSGNYQRKSRSERRRIDIIINMALSMLHPKFCNVILCDELFSAMDEKGMEIIIRFFKSLIEMGKVSSVFLASPYDMDIDVDNRITVIKENGMSHVKE